MMARTGWSRDGVAAAADWLARRGRSRGTERADFYWLGTVTTHHRIFVASYQRRASLRCASNLTEFPVVCTGDLAAKCLIRSSESFRFRAAAVHSSLCFSVIYSTCGHAFAFCSHFPLPNKSACKLSAR